MQISRALRVSLKWVHRGILCVTLPFTSSSGIQMVPRPPGPLYLLNLANESTGAAGEHVPALTIEAVKDLHLSTSNSAQR